MNPLPLYQFRVSSFEFRVSRSASVLAAVSLLGLGLANGGPTPGELVRKGNEEFKTGDYDKALSLYQKANEAKPDSAEIAFDRGAALYRKKDFTGASQLFKEAAQEARDPALSGQAEYNLGNTHYRLAEQTREAGDLKESIKETQQSVGHYRESLRLNPSHRKAAENMELAKVYLKALLDEQKQQPQSQKDQDGEKKDEEQQQQSESKNSSGDKGRNEKDGKQGESSKQQEAQEKDKDSKDQKAQQEKQQQQQQQQGKGEEKKEDKQQKEQQGAEGKEEQKDKNEAAKDEAARAILEEEKENQQRHVRVRASGMKPVEKDW